MCSRSPLWRAVYFCNIDSCGRSMLPEFGRRASAISPKAEPVCATVPPQLASQARNTQQERRMTELKADVLVLGAGMVGVGAALHLQRRGRDVILVDRHPLAGEETSFGNAGMIECASVFPYMFPRDFGQILQYAVNRSPQVRYRFSDLPFSLPWLLDRK